MINREVFVSKDDVPTATNNDKEPKNKATLSTFIEKARGAQYEVTADGRRCSLPINDLLDFLGLSTEDPHKPSAAAPDNKIGQLTMMEFAYAASKYLSENRVLDNYVLPENIRDRMNQLLDGQLIDYYAINQLTETRDTLYEKVNINPELRKVILGQMPEDASRLEKAAYIYIKMCTTLTYDNEYMAGEIAEKHKSLNYVEQISPKNNEVTCFEFNIIYAKLLSELGSNFESKYKDTEEEQYGNVHVYLRFREGKFIVMADSVTSTLWGDLTNAKLGLPLEGFKCENKNEQTQREFYESVSRMYKLVQQQEQDKTPWEEYKSLNESLTNDVKPIWFGGRKTMLLEELKRTSLRGVDLLSYAYRLRKMLFGKEEWNNNISITLLRNNEAIGRDSRLETGAIIALNPINLHRLPSSTNYYYLSSNGVLTPLTLEDIQNKIDKRTFEYIKDTYNRVPGVIGNK